MERNTMGFKNGPMIMQRAMNRIFSDMIGKSMMIYLDDIIIPEHNLETHKKTMEAVLKRLSSHNFRVNPKKKFSTVVMRSRY